MFFNISKKNWMTNKLYNIAKNIYIYTMINKTINIYRKKEGKKNKKKIK